MSPKPTRESSWDGPISWHTTLILVRPRRIGAQLRSLLRAGVISVLPTPWQLELGVLRMWHRLLFRSDTIGTCGEHPVRRGWRPALLRFRILRFPFLVWERAIAPLDHSGLGHGPDRLINHLLTAHHDQNQFIYDLEILSGTPGALESLHTRVEQVVQTRNRRTNWLADLCVFANYHEDLLAATEAALAGDFNCTESDRQNPDICFTAYISWCLMQPATPALTWRAWREGSFPGLAVP